MNWNWLPGNKLAENTPEILFAILAERVRTKCSNSSTSVIIVDTIFLNTQNIYLQTPGFAYFVQTENLYFGCGK